MPQLGSATWYAIEQTIQYVKLLSMLRVTFISLEGERIVVDALPGQSILDVARANCINLPGTCGGSLVCATCHVRISEQFRAKLPPPSESEEDTLDLAFGVTAESRLGCQIRLTDALDGMEIRLASSMPANL